MSEPQLFKTDDEPVHERHQWRLWGADLLELGTAALLGWAALRALERWRGPGALLACMGVAWVMLSVLGGLTGRTLWRHVTGVRLVRGDGEPPGPVRGLARALTTPVGILLMLALQYRPLDRALGLRAERASEGARDWLKGLVWQLPWVGVLGLAAWFILTPTKQEATTFLGRKLQGWHCCHGTRKAQRWQWQCQNALSRLVRDARRGDEDALALAADCPQAAERLGTR